ncbi:hypothetical protein [Mucilaginibacter sp. UYCu711]|uniref:hypothetical protein n=1 Tax=Mucilaginibacter sp. UYCu711 TaxID=3156339 RepID=UPI003D2441D2
MPTGINIYVLDKTSKLSVWEYILPGSNRFWYQLMIPKESARQYPIIINRANYMRQEEYQGFDHIDFKKIIAGLKQK